MRAQPYEIHRLNKRRLEESQAKSHFRCCRASSSRCLRAYYPAAHTQRLCRPRSEQARKMGRRKIDIVRIENERHRQVTYTKRKTGLLKKATELAILCDAQVAVMIFSQNQKLCVYSSAPMEQLMKQYKDYSEAPEVCAAAAPGRHCQAAHRGGFFKLHREPARRAAHPPLRSPDLPPSPFAVDELPRSTA